MALLRETGMLALAAAFLMLVARPLRWHACLSVAIVAAVFAGDYFVHQLKPQAEGQRFARGITGKTAGCETVKCRLLKDISYREKVDQVAELKGINQRFLRWVDAKTGEKDRYYLITGAGKFSTESPFWNTYFLLPRIAVWDEGPRVNRPAVGRDWKRMASADWVVVYDGRPPRSNPPAVALDDPIEFADGFYLVKVKR